jgi:hypothetical protein
LVVVGLSGCGATKNVGTPLERIWSIAPNVTTTAISEILKTATPGQAVYLKGRVGQHVPLLQGTVYELQDSTGSIWIRVSNSGGKDVTNTTQNGADQSSKGGATKGPKQGDEVMIQGIIRYQRIVLNRQDQSTLFVDQQAVWRTGSGTKRP